MHNNASDKGIYIVVVHNASFYFGTEAKFYTCPLPISHPVISIQTP